MLAADLNCVTSSASMADLAPLRTTRNLVDLAQDLEGITLVWDDGRVSRFTAAWLRDNCACPQCRHPQALERTYMFIDHATPTILAAAIGPGEVVDITFAAGSESHSSRFTKGWLREYGCCEDALREREFTQRLWGSDIASRLTTVSYADYMHTSDGVRAWIDAIQTDGVALLKGVPAQPGQLLEVGRRIGPIRATNFGDHYDVVSMPNPNASAYTAMGLELHTDLANWRSPPDVQLLCCLKSTVTGGESVFADGFMVAEELRIADPETHGLLSTHALDFRFHDDSCDIRARAPTIELDRAGRHLQVRFNNWLRAPMRLPEDVIEPMYQALATFWRMLRSPRFHLNVRLEPGDLIAYNNHRVLHGRAPFDPRSGERHLQGCYLNLEDLQSRLRLLDRV
jgi:gamma-butyrobetaine dioxygenase